MGAVKRGRRAPPVRLETQWAARGPGKQESAVSWLLSRGLGGNKVQRCQKSRELEAESCRRQREVCVTLARVFPVGVWSSQRLGGLWGGESRRQSLLSTWFSGFLFSFFSSFLAVLGLRGSAWALVAVQGPGCPTACGS